MNRIVIAVILIILTTSIFAQKRSSRRDHAFSGTLVLSVEGGPTMGFTDYKTQKLDYAAKGMMEYFVPTSSASAFGIRAFGGGGYVTGRDALKTPTEFRTDVLFGGGGLVYAVSLGDAIFPYLFAGGSYLLFNPKGQEGQYLTNNSQGKYKKDIINFNGEFGIRILLARDLSLNFNVGAHVSTEDNLDDLKLGTNNDMFFTGMAGLSLALFGKKDNDGDGIYDDDDACVDEKEDFDGYQDSDGCPDFDNDKDGITDRFDKCPNQPEDFDGFLDEDGCADLDNDKDGILDADDKCPNQPEDFDGFEDSDGCPDPDNDSDGILDMSDKCPNEAENYNNYQDEDGCPDEKPLPPAPAPVEPPKQIVLSAGTNFMSGKAELLPAAYNELDKIVKVMEENPATRWRIEGHTDNVGSAQLNKKLSLARAQAVLRYLTSKGLNPARFEVYGMGKDFPVADNATEQGRAMNRRVVILRLN